MSVMHTDWQLKVKRLKSLARFKSLNIWSFNSVKKKKKKIKDINNSTGLSIWKV